MNDFFLFLRIFRYLFCSIQRDEIIWYVSFDLLDTSLQTEKKCFVKF